MVEVLEQASITVDGLDDLTGLAEYRNGGLFMDFGVLRLRDPSLASVPLPWITLPSSNGARSPWLCWTLAPQAALSPGRLGWGHAVASFFRAAPGMPAGGSPASGAQTGHRRLLCTAMEPYFERRCPKELQWPPHSRTSPCSTIRWSSTS